VHDLHGDRAGLEPIRAGRDANRSRLLYDLSSAAGFVRMAGGEPGAREAKSQSCKIAIIASVALWLRRCESFSDDREADREFWARLTPAERVSLVEQMRREWARISGHPLERLRRTAQVLERPAR
jgi:hypothetical protein